MPLQMLTEEQVRKLLGGKSVSEFMSSYAGPTKAEKQAALDAARQNVINASGTLGWNSVFDPSNAATSQKILEGNIKILRDANLYTPELAAQVSANIEDGVRRGAAAKANDGSNWMGQMLSITGAFILPGVGEALAAALQVPTSVGTALASTAVQVAQGVPIQDAVMNAAISTVVQTGSTDVAKTIVKAGNDPAVANAIASVGGSIAKTAASGGSSTDILNNAVGALAGSGVTSLTADELGTAASRAVGAAVGTAAAGGNTAKVLGAAAGSLGNASTTTSTTAEDTSKTQASDTTASQSDATTQQLINAIANAPDLSGNPSVQVAGQTVLPDASGGYFDNQGRWHANLTGMAVPDKPSTETGGTASETLPGGVAGGLQAAVSGTGEAINIDPNAVITPSTDSTVKTVDLTQGTGSADTSGQTAVTANDQQILNLIGADKTATGGANVAVISPDVVGTTGADANVAPVIVDTSSKSLIDTTTSLANAAGQGADTVTVTADKPASNVATSDQQIIDLISGDTSKTVDTGSGGGTISTGGGTANVATGGASGEIATTDTRTGAGTDTAASTATGAGADTKTTATTGTDAGTRAGTDVAADTGAKTEITGAEIVVEPAPVEQLPEAKTEPAPAEKPAPAEEEVAKDTVPYKPELFIFGGTAPKGRKSSALSQTINAPFYPSTGLTQALTASRPAGEIEVDPSGKKRQNVWNEASLRLKDALGL